MMGPLGLLVGPVFALLDKLIPDKEAAAKAKAEMLELQQKGELKDAELQLSGILAEANSQHTAVALARPMFLYVMYALISLCVIAGILGIWFPNQIQAAALGVQMMLNAIPEPMWWLFGAGYLGYTGGRSFDKWKGTKR